jgi:hypothetical protein
VENSKYVHFWNESKKKRGDIFHTNTLHFLDASVEGIPAFKKGRVLVSFLILNLIAVVDLDKKEVVWAYKGDFKAQHDPQIIPGSSRLVLLDNRGGNPKYGRSRILEYALPDMSPVWTYDGTKKEPFFTRTCGTIQRLPNGNTLVTETDNGRAFEITNKGKIVWEFYNPHRAGPDKELIASLFEVKRIPKSRVRWLNLRTAPEAQ